MEIYLRVTKSSSEPSQHHRRRISPPIPTNYVLPPLHHNVPSLVHYAIPVIGPAIPPANTPVVVPLHPPPSSDGWGAASSPHSFPVDSPVPRGDKPSLYSSWGHIAVFYLVEQMHRWERFVFRFDKQFPSIGALKTICGPYF